MDFRINGGDSVIDSTGKADCITGIDELWQRAYICIAVKKGSFIYNRELGSEIYELDKTDENFAEKLALVMNEALINCEGVQAQIKNIIGRNVTVILSCGGKTIERVFVI